jgi:diguanylate cyclase (GGDEF)-like protein/PAS domain S-box-containing protein
MSHDGNTRTAGAWEVLDHVVEAVSVIDRDGRHLYINAASRAILDDLRERYEQGALAEVPWGAIRADGSPLPNDELPAELTRRTGAACDAVEVGFPGRRGDIHWLRISTRCLGDDGPPYAVVVSFNDITVAREAEQRLQTTMEGLIESVVFYDADGRRQMMNRTAAAILGVEPDEPGMVADIGGQTLVCTDGKPLAQDQWPVNRARLYGEVITGAVVGLAAADGTTRWIEVNARPLRDESLGGPWPTVASFTDITERREYEARLQASEQRQRLVLGRLPGTIVALLDPKLRLVSVDGLVDDPLQRTDDDVRGQHLRDFLGPEAYAVAEPQVRAALRGELASFEHVARDGRVFETDVVPFEEAGEVTGALTLWRDVTARRQLDAARRAAEERFRQAFDHAPNGMMVASLHGQILQANPALGELTGYSTEQLERLSILDLVAPEDEPEVREAVAALAAGRIEGTRADRRWLVAGGAIRWVSVSTSLIRDGQGRPGHVLAHVVDVTERRLIEEELQQRAERDPLTELVNRRTFEHRLALHLARERGGERPGALLMIDLDGFKAVNDTLGHQAGDDLLVAVARAIDGEVRRSDCVARLGGDEFAVLIEDADRDDARHVAEKVRGAVAAAGARWRDRTACRVTASVGVALAEGHVHEAEALVAAADAAMYSAKHAGRDRIVFAPA